ncbi:RNase adapter RapZ [Pseudobacteriovorax antillogorgiicola]|uniref:UPF0042 nucleotide-binding protein n=1 Tax=Pseudobacteriovorax antillogorgiicola TaxID=1513793 RepID=A0A1Y6B6X9_9BACT|nr:RNase adapter RapZ [Pseudobacteriovorax antillogorgiicola]TCS59129.1 UPF0042 nucleotide-binding protein [Pseudobacteriovorax antillogorgiicola]SME91438.1 UPF0042 nucleotide-binding protein [Pseudobacteriovorax antillogorgiicola]
MSQKTEQIPSLVIVSGLSGAGKSIAINALEDMSYYCIDNLPLELVEDAVSYFITNDLHHSRLALGMDVRSSDFVERFMALRDRLKKKIQLSVLFVTASDEALATRFSTNRRRHPLHQESGELIAAIRREAQALAPMIDEAEVVFDTTAWSPHYLMRQVEKHYGDGVMGRSLFVTVTSFGFKHGALKPADSIYDVRCLKNPHFEPSLKPRTGLEKDVSDYVFSDPHAGDLLDKLIDLHKFLLPCYYDEGKHYFSIGIGCTGGQHRSVALAEKLAFALADLSLPNIYVSVSHRDL